MTTTTAGQIITTQKKRIPFSCRLGHHAPLCATHYDTNNDYVYTCPKCGREAGRVRASVWEPSMARAMLNCQYTAAAHPGWQPQSAAGKAEQRRVKGGSNG